MKNEEAKHSRTLFEIIRGHSLIDCDNKNYYFKHFTLLEILELDHLEDLDIKKSVRSGIKKEKDLIAHAIKKGFWSVKEEEKIKSLEWTLKRSTTALGKIEDLKQKEIFKNQINNQEEELKDIRGKRAKITSYSAEHASEVKKVKRMVNTSIFLDEKFETKPENTENNILITTLLFQKFKELNSRDNILYASFYGGFFDLFAAQNGNSIELLGKTIQNITSFQKNLIVLSNALLNKIKNVKIPEDISDNPVKVMDYVEKDESQSKVSHGVDDLRARAKARGGELKAEDFLS
jgi:glycerophosphoryl diester phosphodiesterase